MSFFNYGAVWGSGGNTGGNTGGGSGGGTTGGTTGGTATGSLPEIFVETTNPAATDGKDGDLWMNTVTGDWFDKEQGAWVAVGNTTGPIGPAGGASVYTGTGAPLTALGKDGDKYFDLGSAEGDEYAKAAGSWSLTGNTVKGPQGDPGPQGPAGPNGGQSVFIVNGPPADTLGIDGDVAYDDDDGGQPYLKASGTWGTTTAFRPLRATQFIPVSGVPQASTGREDDIAFDISNGGALYQKTTPTVWTALGSNLFIPGADGPAGPSAYDVAVANGFVGDQNAWLASLGGIQGPDGLSAFEVWQSQPGNGAKTFSDFLAAITGPVGPTGPRGPDGVSAYAIAVAQGFVGTETEWLDALIGPAGPQGPKGDGFSRLTTAEREALVMTVSDKGETVYDLDDGRTYVWNGARWDDIAEPRIKSADVVLRHGVDFDTLDEMFDLIASRSGRLCIAYVPAGVTSRETQIVPPKHSFDYVSVRVADQLTELPGVTLVSITGTAGAYEVTVNVPNSAAYVGQTGQLVVPGTVQNPQGNTGPFFELNAAIRVKAVNGTQITFDLASQMPGLDSAAITLNNAEFWPDAATWAITGKYNAALDPVKHGPSRLEIIDRSRNHEIRSNILMNPAPSTADDQGALHMLHDSKYEFFNIGIDLSQIGGITDENRQEHCIHAARSGYIEFRGGSLYGAPKGACLSTDMSQAFILNASWSGCNRGNKSADGVYSQMGGHVRAFGCRGGHQPKAAARAREGGKLTIQGCDLHGADFAVDAEDGAHATASGDFRRNRIAAIRCMDDAIVTLVRFTALSECGRSIIADDGTVNGRDWRNNETINSAPYVFGGSSTEAEDVQVLALGKVVLADDAGLTVSNAGFYNGMLAASAVEGGGGGGGASFVNPSVPTDAYRLNAVNSSDTVKVALLGNPATQLEEGLSWFVLRPYGRATPPLAAMIFRVGSEWDFVTLGGPAEHVLEKEGTALKLVSTTVERVHWNAVKWFDHSTDESQVGHLYNNAFRHDDIANR